MNVRELYEQMLAGNSITLEFSTRADFLSIFSQFRSIKSKFDKTFSSLTGNTLSAGKVIKTTQVDKSTQSYIFELADRKVIEKIAFKILEITPDGAGQETENVSAPET